jgi:hypothetical protein
MWPLFESVWTEDRWLSHLCDNKPSVVHFVHTTRFLEFVMSDTSTTVTVRTVPWLVVFIIIKLFGTVLADWSWWWVLLPVVPDVYALLKVFGVVS